MTHLYLIPPLFFIIATIFSMLGMGGGQLYIPILFWMGLDFKTQAIPLGLLLNVTNSSSAAFTYTRAKLIKWQIAIPFGLAMIISPPFGTLLDVHLPTAPIVLCFAFFSGLAGVLMLTGWKPQRQIPSRWSWVIAILGGLFLGFLTGLIGRGGGSFVVPLLLILGLEPKMAAATSSVVVTFSGISGFLSHIAMAASPNWPLWISCVIAVFLGSQLGSNLMARRLKSRTIKYIFGWVLIAVAIILSYQAVTGK